MNLHKREPVRAAISSNCGSVRFFSGATQALAITKDECLSSRHCTVSLHACIYKYVKCQLIGTKGLQTPTWYVKLRSLCQFGCNTMPFSC